MYDTLNRKQLNGNQKVLSAAVNVNPPTSKNLFILHPGNVYSVLYSR